MSYYFYAGHVCIHQGVLVSCSGVRTYDVPPDKAYALLREDIAREFAIRRDAVLVEHFSLIPWEEQ